MNSNQNNFVHPELRVCEEFFTNANLQGFQDMNYKTKRIGNVAYDGIGNRLKYIDWYPVFLKKDEVMACGRPIKELRRVNS